MFGDHNIAFKYGDEHKALRKSFLHLFTRKALGIYLHIQERLIRSTIDTWNTEATEAEMRIKIRDMNLLTR